jgi:hypothetical protein
VFRYKAKIVEISSHATNEYTLEQMLRKVHCKYSRFSNIEVRRLDLHVGIFQVELLSSPHYLKEKYKMRAKVTFKSPGSATMFLRVGKHGNI